MRDIGFGFIAWVLFAGVACAAEVDGLAWLEGSWAGMVDGVEMEEHWTHAKGGAILGMHRDVKQGRMISFEFFRIEATPDGIVYFASPRSRPPTPFKLVSLQDRHVIFENAAHDSPQRIHYWLDAENVLHARVEGTRQGKTMSEEWAWHRVRRS
jgi:hypothetical protein